MHTRILAGVGGSAQGAALDGSRGAGAVKRSTMAPGIAGARDIAHER
jgi:hypothetical protein